MALEAQFFNNFKKDFYIFDEIRFKYSIMKVIFYSYCDFIKNKIYIIEMIMFHQRTIKCYEKINWDN